jgi:hypothetical protein
MIKESALPGGSVETDKWNNSPELQKALQITWLLNGDLKNLQITYLRVAVRLAQVRDEKLHTHMNHPDIEGYADDHLHLQKTTLYRYLRVYDFVKAKHPQWLEPKPKGFIPDLYDLYDLAWIEKELERKDLSEERRKGLDALRKKALKGDLHDGDLAAFRRRGHKVNEGMRAFLSALRALVRRAAKLISIPPEVIGHLKTAVSILENQKSVEVAKLELPQGIPQARYGPEIS